MDTRTESVVYFVRNTGTGHVKIGTTTSFEFRLGKMRRFGGGAELEVLGVIDGGSGLESSIHRKFSSDRIMLEWFKDSSELREYIRKHGRKYEPPSHNNDNGYVTPEDVGKEIGLSTRQILYYIDAKKLKAENMGRFWVITRADADAFIDWYREAKPKPGRPRIHDEEE